MKTSRIKIRNILGIQEFEMGQTSLELMGPKGAGKTSVLDAIRWALTNKSDRDWIIREGAEEGEILIETDTGLSIDRKARTAKADMIKVKDGNLVQGRPAEFLAQIFTPLQLNPVLFTQFSAQEKNREILNLIEYAWDIAWIQDKFGEVPKGVNYQQHILQVLSDIQSEGGVYYQSRQEINSRKLHLNKSVEDIAVTIPQGYDYEHWSTFELGKYYRELEEIRHQNNQIEQAKAFTEAYNDKLRGLQAERQIKRSAAESEASEQRNSLNVTIERLKAEILAAEKERDGLKDKLADKYDKIESQFELAKADLLANTDVKQKWASMPVIDTTAKVKEIKQAEDMRLHLNEYKTMLRMQGDVKLLQEQSDELTRKIELARNLPGEILKTATIPVEGLTVKDGKPYMFGRPISNLSDGELMELCVDVTIQKPGGLQILLLDKAEGLDTKSREKLYAKCKEKGLQLIATRVTDSDELEVVEL